MPTTEPREGDDFVQSLARGLRVIRAYDADHASLTLSDVAKRADVSPAAARRFLRTLETLGYVRNDGREFVLTPRVLELGFSYLSALSLPEVIQPHLENLSRTLDESVSAAVLDGTEIVYIARVLTRSIMSVRITVGTRLPAYATSMGRVLLAGLSPEQADGVLADSNLVALTPKTVVDAHELRAEIERVRHQGWALVDGELEEGLRSIAAPVRDRNGAVVAAINVSMSAIGKTIDAVRNKHIPLLVHAASRIDADLRLI